MEKEIKSGDIVLIKSALEAFGEENEDRSWGEHYFLVDEIFGDCVSGYSINGSLAGVYGEPEFELIKAVFSLKGDKNGSML